MDTSTQKKTHIQTASATEPAEPALTPRRESATEPYERELAREIATMDQALIDADARYFDLNERMLKAVAALEKIADPRKRDHKEPDAYTTLGCVMHIAEECLAEIKA